MAIDRSPIARQGRQAALVIAGTGLFWIAATFLGEWMGWSLRTRALFDLIALAGFGAGLWLTFQLWRGRKADTTKGMAPGNGPTKRNG